MDITTKYLGMTLRSPIVASASPLSDKIDNIKKMEDCGTGAVVMYSLFEEQLRLEQLEMHYHTTQGTEGFAESLTFYPEPDDFRLGPDDYLEHIRKAKESVEIPVIASLNGCTPGGWTEYAVKMQEAGADAIELNLYNIPTAFDTSGEKLEQSYIDILKLVKKNLNIPVAVKLSPFFSNMANMAKKLDEAGANALVLFNRFYQPDINLESLDVIPNVLLSHSAAMRLPMRWIAILKGRINADLAATSGIHTGEDVLKMMMAGANVAMLCSALLKNGISHIKTVVTQMKQWMLEHEYDSISMMQGSMSQVNVANPGAFERAQYMKAINKYKLG